MRTGPTERASRAHDAQPRLPNLLRNCQRLRAFARSNPQNRWKRMDASDTALTSNNSE